MANAVYPLFKEKCLQSTAVPMNTATIVVHLIDLADYTYNAAHDFEDDIPAGGSEEETAGVGSKTFTNGTFDHGDLAPAWSGTAGDQCEALIWSRDNAGTAATSELIVFMDTSITGMPVTLGGDINLTLNASGVFSL